MTQRVDIPDVFSSWVDKLVNYPTSPSVFPSWLDKSLSYPIIFSLIVLFQGCFGGMGVIQTPQMISNSINSPITRFIFLLCIAYTATSNFETAIVSVIIFLIFLQVIRTREERKKLKSYF